MHCATSQEAKFYATISSRSRDQEGHGITLPCCLMLRLCSPEMYLCSLSIFPPGSLSFIPFYIFYYNCILMFLVILLFFVVLCYLSLLLRATPLRGVHFFQQQIEGSTWIPTAVQLFGLITNKIFELKFRTFGRFSEILYTETIN